MYRNLVYTSSLNEPVLDTRIMQADYISSSPIMEHKSLVKWWMIS